MFQNWLLLDSSFNIKHCHAHKKKNIIVTLSMHCSSSQTLSIVAHLGLLYGLLYFLNDKVNNMVCTLPSTTKM